MPNDFGRIALAVRNGGPVPTGFFECWTRLLVNGTRDGDLVLAPVSRKPAHQAANLLVGAFLKTECDTICFVDNDHAFGHDALERLRSRPASWEYDAVGALYLARGLGKAVILKEREDSLALPPRTAGIYLWPEQWEPGTLAEVDGLGLGFTLIRRRVFEQLPAPWFFYPPESDNSSEDLAFFRLVKAAGYRMAVDTSLPIGHLIDNFAQGLPKDYMEAAAKIAGEWMAKPAE